MPELVLWLRSDRADAVRRLVSGFRELGAAVVESWQWLSGPAGRFEGIVADLRRTELPRFLQMVDELRPEWFLLVDSDVVELPGYGVQQVTAPAGKSFQFGHRSGWVVSPDLVASPETAAMAIAQRRPASPAERASLQRLRKSRRGRRPVRLPAGRPQRYPGGKGGAGVWQAIVNQMPPHDCYVEGCLGRGAVLRNKRPAEASVGIEADGDVLRAHWTGYDAAGALRLVEGDVKAWLRDAFGLGVVPGLSRCGCCGARWESDPATLVDAAGSARACAVCGRTVMVYVDPPYLRSTRKDASKALYRHEWTAADHGELLLLLKRLPCYVAVSGYDSTLYRNLLRSWRLVTFSATTSGGTKAIEHLWCNYPPPEALHDPRWLGSDRRARERWRRRSDSMARKLSSLSGLERQAVLDRVGEIVDG